MNLADLINEVNDRHDEWGRKEGEDVTTQLTPAGRVWAEKNAETSVVANVALFGEGWPLGFAEASRKVANESGASAIQVAESSQAGA